MTSLPDIFLTFSYFFCHFNSLMLVPYQFKFWFCTYTNFYYNKLALLSPGPFGAVGHGGSFLLRAHISGQEFVRNKKFSTVVVHHKSFSKNMSVSSHVTIILLNYVTIFLCRNWKSIYYFQRAISLIAT